MSARMTVFGAGHKMGLVILPVLVPTILIAVLYPDLCSFGRLAPWLRFGFGSALVAVGLTINFVSAFAMMRAFGQKRLLTNGTYGLSRNPMYTSFILFTIPGVSLLLNCWAVLAVSPAIYAATVIFVKEEEAWLAMQFGARWEDYARRVGRVFPKVWR